MLVVAIGGLTVVGSLLLGLLLGSSVQRSLAVGFYLVGSFLLVAGFFFGNRGPVRGDADSGGLLRLGSRRLRWATRDETEEAINQSAVWVAIGFVLIVLGIASDNRHALF